MCGVDHAKTTNSQAAKETAGTPQADRRSRDANSGRGKSGRVAKRRLRGASSPSEKAGTRRRLSDIVFVPLLCALAVGSWVMARVTGEDNWMEAG